MYQRLTLNIWGNIWEECQTLAVLFLTKGEDEACSIQGWAVGWMAGQGRRDVLEYSRTLGPTRSARLPSVTAKQG